MTIETKTTEKFTPRVRFNWGFWDGLRDQKKGNPKRVIGAQLGCLLPGHKWFSYRSGYYAGFRESNHEIESSEAAWQRFLPHI